MIQTIKFRLYPTSSDEKKLHELFTIYNRIKRIGYKYLFFQDICGKKIYTEQTIQQALKNICQNNPYVNTILIENSQKLAQQKTWFEKRKKYLTHQIQEIKNKINEIKVKDARDRRLRGLYGRLSSIQNKLKTLKLEPIIFGGKQVFRERVLKKIPDINFKLAEIRQFVA